MEESSTIETKLDDTKPVSMEVAIVTVCVIATLEVGSITCVDGTAVIVSVLMTLLVISAVMVGRGGVTESEGAGVTVL